MYFIFRGERVASRKKKNSEGVWLACSAGVFFGRASVFARESFMMAATTIRTRTRFRPPIGVFPALFLRAALHYPNAWNGLCQHGPRGVGLLEDMINFLCPGGWVLRISRDRDDRRVFGGLKFSISGFLGVGKFWQVFSSFGSLIEVGIFLGIQNNLKIRDSYTVKFRK